MSGYTYAGVPRSMVQQPERESLLRRIEDARDRMDEEDYQSLLDWAQGEYYSEEGV